MLKEKLKIGILLNDYKLANWELRIIEAIKDSGFSKITLVILNERTCRNNISKISGVFQKAVKIIFNLHLKLDELILARETDYSKVSDSKNLLNDVDSLSIIPTANKTNFSDTEISEIKNYNLDVILRFDSDKLNGEILNAAKYGVWSYEAFSKQGNKSEPLGYWEVISNSKTTSTILQILNDDADECKILHRSEMLTHNLSISKNRNACYWRAATIIPQIIEGLYNYGITYLIKQEKKHTDNNYSRKTNESFSCLTALKNIFIHFFKVSKRIFQKLFFNDHWDVLYKINSIETSFPSIEEFKLLPAPSDRFWADPFVISKDNRHYIFVEELLYKTNKGHIAVIELDNKGKVIDSKKILERPYHLSYPFLFQHNGTYYMIPETGGNKTIELYRCKAFPYEWEFVMNLMEEIDTADATLFYHNNKWWLFCCIDKSGKNVGMLDELHLFFADDLFTTNWQSHPNNPICTNTRTARPAGKIFLQNSKIYRPSQNCSGIYGRGININEIIKLSETEYQEAVVKKIIPEDENDLIGTHTFNFSDKITLIDGFKYRRKKLVNL